MTPADPKAQLTWYAAVWDAFMARPMEFYPRLVIDGQPTTLSGSDTGRRLAAATEGWPVPLADNLDQALKLARESLDEAKSQTEYQDQKATRLLTITTFVSALSGALFTRFADRFPLPAIDFGSATVAGTVRFLAICAGYLGFGLFVLTAAMGALVSFHAIRTRFKYPKPDMNRQEVDPVSQIFYAPMISVTPEAWAKAYADRTPGGSRFALRPDLADRYLRSYVVESYLIAAKTADKLRYLEPAQRLLSFALSCLLLWLLLVAGLSAFVSPEKKAAEPAQAWIAHR